ncbi:NAD(P)/FAD-dependent oxidoreductase [Sphingobacterium sp. E70]|uniref:NAD(P)-binding protein n=1 Tax=Sphingobacterium sp. E70 TaxID=2853439 RepID=UPI00211BEE98|nr:FAD/NAD(P)-binding protein [Sphingobacterium sp. E70]ULT26378.1 NAD(P)/FAD-dependent oxidoreductase [Sphingobacterium sp. E70]
MVEIPILILGAGVTGLSAAYRLQQRGMNDFLLLDMESEVGGNARHGENAYSRYPLGAHYLPIPNASNKELLRFLEESKIIVGWTEGVFHYLMRNNCPLLRRNDFSSITSGRKALFPAMECPSRRRLKLIVLWRR